MRSRTFLLILLLLTSCAALANSGDADPAFGTGGITLLDFTPLSGAPGSVGTTATAVDRQGRVWVAASVQGTADGLGLARLKRDGTLDGSFGSGGLIYFNTGWPADVLGIRVGPDGIYLGYAQRPTFSVAIGLTWAVCRLAENGSFDSSFYGSGCKSFTTPYGTGDGTLPVDMQVNPVDASVWVLGWHSDHAAANDKSWAIAAIVDQGNAGVTTYEFPRLAHTYTASKSAFNSAGQLFFTGNDFQAGGYTSANAVLAYVTRNGASVTPTFVDSPLATPYGTTAFNYGRCIAVDHSTGAVRIGIDGTDPQWAAIDTITTNYGNVSPGTSVFTPATMANESFALNDCALGADGSFHLAGKWHFPDPRAAGAYTDAAIVQRVDPQGAGDATFNGHTPGTFPGFETALGVGAVAHSVPTPTDLRAGIATSINAWHGPLVVGVVSARLDASGSDVAVMRLLTDEIFNDGFQP